MERGSIKDLSKYRYEKAESDLELAKSLFKDGYYSYALNRAYYAVFAAMRAVNALDGFDSGKHSGVISHFNQVYVKTGIFPISSSAVIRKASMLREKSDYEDFFIAEEEETAEIIDKTEEFLAGIKVFLQHKEIL